MLGDKDPAEVIGNGISDHETPAAKEQETQIQETSPGQTKPPSDTIDIEGSREGVLITEEQAKEKASTPPRDEGMSTTHSNLTPSPHPSQKEAVKPVTRPWVLEGFTEAIKTGYGNLYVTVNSYEGKPFEVFVQIGKSGFTTMADAEATGRLISLSLRSGVDVRDVVEQLEAIGGSSPVFSGGRVIMSVPDAIAKVLRSHFVENGRSDDENN